MRFVQKTIWFVVTLIAGILEILMRSVIFFPIGLILTIIASFVGAKQWTHNNLFLDYCCPWKLGSKHLPIAGAISNWFDPEMY
jgi:hypothetical protein